MTSLAGCSGEAFASILKSLGFHMETRPGPAITVPLVPKAPTEPVRTKPADETVAEGEGADVLADASAETPADQAEETQPEETPAQEAQAEEMRAEGQSSEEATLTAE